MKLDRIAGDVIWLVKEHELQREASILHIARNASAGEMIYAPIELREPVTRPPGKHVEPRDPEDRDPDRGSRPDPRRVDALRAALRARGLELRNLGAFYFEVIAR